MWLGSTGFTAMSFAAYQKRRPMLLLWLWLRHSILPTRYIPKAIAKWGLSIYQCDITWLSPDPAGAARTVPQSSRERVSV